MDVGSIYHTVARSPVLKPQKHATILAYKRTANEPVLGKTLANVK